ncbi:MAG: amidohydrolase family protein [Polyangiaceae bacterium]
MGDHLDRFMPCLHDGTPSFAKFFDEPEGSSIPQGQKVVDAHVHLFPPPVFEAIWRWFDTHAWPIRYRLYSEQVIEFLLARGVFSFCALHYSHRPGMARLLNRYVSEIARAHSQVIPLATVLPGEPDAVDVLREAFDTLGARGVKLHCHVQQMAADDARLDEIYAYCEAVERPILIHAGREPSFSAYGVDCRALLASTQIARVLERHPKLKLVVAHLGADEFVEYEALLDDYDNLWLDTTMTLGEYFQVTPQATLFPGRASRLLYGSDFPNLPYAWDRELTRAVAAPMSEPERRALLSENALRLFGA